ncbi:hypothetical protein KIH31_13400 [Paenarthrobacter sp. DKR-5]|uniref:hypothetical protein n=1 Tax=Paenarthrobacter sp. DKR-5 TaxID=2835535 RepID=UPI001BDBE28F|nr:hypothetical protein [Paenarthrobacter sp. DKR-5]MBT1003598.1 hypothetical protein [Paenarthrobacter sp. DKR-5]
MAFFAAARQARRDDAELGKGVWRRAHDRFRRGLDRYHQVLEGVDDDALYNDLAALANDLAALLPRVRAVCREAHYRAPSEELDIPGALIEVHRELSRAGNSLATTAEAAAMARLGVADPSTPRRRAQAVFDQVAACESLMRR